MKQLVFLMGLMHIVFLNSTKQTSHFSNRNIISSLRDIVHLFPFKEGTTVYVNSTDNDFITITPSQGSIRQDNKYIIYVLKKGTTTFSRIYIDDNQQQHIQSINVEVK